MPNPPTKTPIINKLKLGVQSLRRTGKQIASRVNRSSSPPQPLSTIKSELDSGNIIGPSAASLTPTLVASHFASAAVSAGQAGASSPPSGSYKSITQLAPNAVLTHSDSAAVSTGQALPSYSPVGPSYYPAHHAYEPMPYMPGGAYAYNNPFPMPMQFPAGYDDGYYTSSPYYPSRRLCDHCRHHRDHSYRPRVYYKHRTLGDRFMTMLGMPQSHLYRM